MAEGGMLQSLGFKAAHASGTDWSGTAKACVEALGDPPLGADLGFLYATDALAPDLNAILAYLREATGIEDWIGTVGLGVLAGDREYYDEPALAILVGSFPDDAYHPVAAIRDPEVGLDPEATAWARSQGATFGVVHGDPRNPLIGEILNGLSETSRGFLVGGLTASRGEFPQVAGRVTEGGLSGALFAPDCTVVAGLTQGCSPIGPVRRITEAQDNVIMAIDDRPALEVFKEDIGELLARDLRKVGGYIFVGFPIAGSDTGDYLVRNLVAIDPEQGWIGVGEEIEAGQSLLFCRRDLAAAQEDLQRMLSDVARRADGKAKAGLYFSCIARGKNLFGPNGEELAMLRGTVGDIPLIGLFANGEISNDRLYGYTGVLALFL